MRSSGKAARVHRAARRRSDVADCCEGADIPVIGFINGASATAYAVWVEAFIRGLGETSLTVNENIAIEYRWAEGSD